MKRILAAMLLLALAVGLCGCKDAGKDMYIERAQLTKEEEQIVKLLGTAQGSELIYDFKLDESAKTMQVNSYELIDGQWQMISGGGGYALKENTGRLALQFERIGEDLRVAIQNGDDCSASEYSMEIEEAEGLAHASSAMTDRAQIEYDKEIPLAVQILTSKMEIRSFAPDFYFTPEEYAQYGYEHVYAVTVLFDTEDLR